MHVCSNVSWINLLQPRVTPKFKYCTWIHQPTFLRQKMTQKTEFDPGSEWTLAICLTHASRTLVSSIEQLKTKWCNNNWSSMGLISRNLLHIYKSCCILSTNEGLWNTVLCMLSRVKAPWTWLMYVPRDCTWHYPLLHLRICGWENIPKVLDAWNQLILAMLDLYIEKPMRVLYVYAYPNIPFIVSTSK